MPQPWRSRPRSNGEASASRLDSTHQDREQGTAVPMDAALGLPKQTPAGVDGGHPECWNVANALVGIAAVRRGKQSSALVVPGACITPIAATASR